jgi:hypothetical protein
VDLQEQSAKGRVDRSSSSQQSQKNDMLKQYDDAMFEFNKTINSNRSNNHNSPNHKHRGINDEVIMSFDGSTMYSPSSSIVGEDFIDDNNQSSSSSSRYHHPHSCVLLYRHHSVPSTHLSMLYLLVCIIR